MSAAFNGAARLERDDAAMQAVFRGAGQDSLSQSRANGDITYRLQALSPGETQVREPAVFAAGALAQFSRSGLVRDFVRRMIADFGNNVTARLRRPAAAGGAPVQPSIPRPCSSACCGRASSGGSAGAAEREAAPAASGVDT